jgi:hypothetical protein
LHLERVAERPEEIDANEGLIEVGRLRPTVSGAKHIDDANAEIGPLALERACGGEA